MSFPTLALLPCHVHGSPDISLRLEHSSRPNMLSRWMAIWGGVALPNLDASRVRCPYPVFYGSPSQYLNIARDTPNVMHTPTMRVLSETDGANHGGTQRLSDDPHYKGDRTSHLSPGVPDVPQCVSVRGSRGSVGTATFDDLTWALEESRAHVSNDGQYSCGPCRNLFLFQSLKRSTARFFPLVLSLMAQLSAMHSPSREVDVQEGSSTSAAAINATSATGATAPVTLTKSGNVSKMRAHRGNVPTLPQTKFCHLCPAKFTRTTHLNRHLKTRE